MSNVDINVDRRTHGLTDGRTDGLTDGRTENRTPISHPATSRCDKNEVEKRAIPLIIIGRFYPKSNLTIFYDYIPVYKI